MLDSSIENSPVVVIRPAAVGDLEPIAAIYAGYVTDSVVTFEVDPPLTEEWHRRFAGIVGVGQPFLVAESADNGEILGYAYCSPWKSREAYRQTAENSIYLAPQARGLGLGGRLLDALITAARDTGIRELIAVITDSGNPASPALHRRRGFREVGRLTRVGYKHGLWLDTLLMQLSLIPGDEVPDEEGPR